MLLRNRCPSRRPADAFLLLLKLSCEHALKIRDRAFQSGLERDARLPVRRSRAREISGQRCLGSSAGSGRYSSREREPVRDMISSATSLMVISAGLPRLTGSGKSADEIHEEHQPLYKIVDKTERSCLRAVTIDRDRFVLQGLYDEIRNHPSVIRVHFRSVGIEDARDSDLEIVLAVIVVEERLRAALALVITRAGPRDVDEAR